MGGNEGKTTLEGGGCIAGWTKETWEGMQWRTHDGRGMGKGDEGGNKGGDDGNTIAGDEKHTGVDRGENIGDEGIMQDGMIGRMWRDDASVGGHNKH